MYPISGMQTLVLVDNDTDRAFVVYSNPRDQSGDAPGTPVLSIRLPPS